MQYFENSARLVGESRLPLRQDSNGGTWIAVLSRG